MKKAVDDFGDRMKNYESEYDIHLKTDRPIIVRIDGKRFSKFTKGMKKPFDIRMTFCMHKTLSALMEETHANIGYTQSDEITLVFLPKNGKVNIPFDGRLQKVVSIFAASATANFISAYKSVYDSTVSLASSSEFHMDGVKEFQDGVVIKMDCRAFNVPDLGEAANAILWRIQDGQRNAISSTFRWSYGHSAMQNMSSKEMLQHFENKNFDFETSIDPRHRNGIFMFRKPETHTRREDGSEYTRYRIVETHGGEFSEKSFSEKIDLLKGSVRDE